eukprot:TRINITY_DN2605_c0_g1_i1.p2 TRINITY_DN2605_c0_g1~~TRINITY_DN2605_c0_g1_i1.p2  ORF type:complete len:316 (+),score=114.35 TRINITY_DN2605_c0_g1_i1:60-1007(+)
MENLPPAARAGLGAAALYLGYKAVSAITNTPAELKGRVGLVTGGGAGVGRLVALRLASFGVSVVLWDLSEEGMLQTMDMIKQKYPRVQCWCHRVDVGDRDAVYRTAAKVNAEISPRHVSVLVNNAGIVSGTTLLDTDDKRIVNTFRVNTLAHFWTCKAFLPMMIQKKLGHVVTVASIAGLTAAPRMVDYASSKFAAVGFTEGLRRELHAIGSPEIRTSTICPAHINTDLFKGFAQPLAGSLDPRDVADQIVDSVRYCRTMVVLPPQFDPRTAAAFLSADAIDRLGRAAGTGDLNMMKNVDLEHANKRMELMNAKL